MIVSSYGLHWAPGDVPFLVQPLGSQNLISPSLECPFVPHIRPKRLRCPHNIDLSTTAEADWISDPLAAAFLPIPRQPGEPAKAILDPDGKLEPLLAQLSRLCSATEPLMRPLWWRTPNESLALYTVTNITPLVWTGAELRVGRDALRHEQLGRAGNRRVLLVCRERLPLFDGWEWITSDLNDIRMEPLEAIGAGALRRYMVEGPQR